MRGKEMQRISKGQEKRKLAQQFLSDPQISISSTLAFLPLSWFSHPAIAESS